MTPPSTGFRAHRKVVRTLAPALMAAVAALGCKSAATGPSTGVVVEVTTDLSVPAELSEVLVLATSSAGRELFRRSYPLVSGGNAPFYTLPLRATLKDDGAAGGAPFHVEVRGLRGNTVTVSRAATLSFAREQVVLLPLPLLAVCVGVLCPDSATTCKTQQTCEPDAVDPGTLAPYPAGADAGAPPPGDDSTDADGGGGGGAAPDAAR